MKGTFRKAIGIAAVFIVLGVVVMIALSPRREGFCPGLFSFGNKPASGQSGRDTAPVRAPEASPDSMPAASAGEAIFDTLTVK